MMCLFQHFHIQQGQLNQTSWADCSYRSVSIAASFIEFNGPTDFWTCAVVKQLHLAAVIISILKAQCYSADYN